MSTTRMERTARIRLDPAEIEHRLAAGATLPADFYVDPEIFELEREIIFGRSWEPVCLEQHLSQVGDYFAATVGGVPIVVVRDENGELRAHVNVCRHRAHLVASGTGNRRTLQCPYHGWTYDLSGCVRSVPRGTAENVRIDGLALVPAFAETWAGIVFVSLNPYESLHEYLGELPTIMAENGYPFPFEQGVRLELDRRIELPFACNWKLSLENSMECYHCPVAHSASFAQYYLVTPEGYTYGNYDRGSFHRGHLRREAASTLGIPKSGRPDLNTYYHWPNVSFRNGSGPWAWGYTLQRLIPTRVDACVMVIDVYREVGGESVEPNEDFTEMLELTLREDQEVCASAQIGLTTGRVRFGQTLEVSETNIRHFHELTWRALSPYLRYDRPE